MGALRERGENAGERGYVRGGGGAETNALFCGDRIRTRERASVCDSRIRGLGAGARLLRLYRHVASDTTTPGERYNSSPFCQSTHTLCLMYSPGGGRGTRDM